MESNVEISTTIDQTETENIDITEIFNRKKAWATVLL